MQGPLCPCKMPAGQARKKCVIRVKKLPSRKFLEPIGAARRSFDGRFRRLESQVVDPRQVNERPMKSFAIRNLLCVAAVSTMIFSSIRAADEPAASTSVIATAITKPSEERKLAFAGPGLVSNVAVKEGDIIKKGQVLAAQDTREDEFALKSFEREANSNDKIQYSKDDLAVKQVTQKRKHDLFLQDRAASQSEVEEADLAVKLAVAQIALAGIGTRPKRLRRCKAAREDRRDAHHQPNRWHRRKAEHR